MLLLFKNGIFQFSGHQQSWLLNFSIPPLCKRTWGDTFLQPFVTLTFEANIYPHFPKQKKEWKLQAFVSYFKQLLKFNCLQIMWCQDPAHTCQIVIIWPLCSAHRLMIHYYEVHRFPSIRALSQSLSMVMPKPVGFSLRPFNEFDLK